MIGEGLIFCKEEKGRECPSITRDCCVCFEGGGCVKRK